MTAREKKEPYFRFVSYPRDWLSFVTGPQRFLGAIDPDTRAARQAAVEYFFLGLTGTLALSALNGSASGGPDTHAYLGLKDAIRVGLLLGGAFAAIAAAGAAAILGGRLRLVGSLVTFGYTLGFLWPATAALLILLSRGASLALGVAWTALIPFDTPVHGFAAPTLGAIAWGALFCAILLWAMGYILYCYAAALRVAAGIGLVRALVASAIAVGATDLAAPWLGAFAAAIGDRFGPLIEWILELF